MTGTAGRALARAALVGNPSDGYGGAVLALTLTAFSAEATVGSGDTVAPDLVAATIARFAHEFHVDAAPVTATTAIPRSVGLGGSSAIVIATLRALCRAHNVALEPDTMAVLALSIEVDDLGIAAGLQDRLVQCHGGLVFMDFGGARPFAERLVSGVLPPLVVGWCEDHSEESGVVHSDLKGRYERNEPGVREAMTQLGDLARSARNGLLGGSVTEFRTAVDASFDIRAQLIELDPRHVAMIEAARSVGAAANYTGSGGAVVCACNDLDHRDAVAQVLREGGAETVLV